MDGEKAQKRKALQKRLAPPKESTTSMVLNGIGNGMMIGFAPFMAMEMLGSITGNHALTERYAKASVAATIAGVVFGGWYGYKEASRLEEYRHSLRKEVVDLHNRIADYESEHMSWAEKMDRSKERSAAAAPDAPSRS